MFFFYPFSELMCSCIVLVEKEKGQSSSHDLFKKNVIWEAKIYSKYNNQLDWKSEH